MIIFLGFLSVFLGSSISKGHLLRACRAEAFCIGSLYLSILYIIVHARPACVVY